MSTTGTRVVPAPADFGGPCLIGECAFTADVVDPSASFLGLRKSASYVMGTWTDADGNLLRAMRALPGDASTMRVLYTSVEGGQLEVDEQADAGLYSGPIEVARRGDVVTFVGGDGAATGGFEFRHEADGCAWTDGDFIAVTGSLIGPGVQWFNTWEGGSCFTVTGKYRTRGTFLGRPVEGFVSHEIHYWPPTGTWREYPYGQGREVCWQQIANEYEDGSIVQATFAYGGDGWGFAMVHDEDGAFHSTTDVQVEAVVRPSGFPDAIRYRFLDQSWTWRIGPRGERPASGHGPMVGADGTCTRDGDERVIRHSMGNSDWWLDGRAADAGILRDALR